MSSESRWVWEEPRRGFWARLLLWLRPSPAREEGEWVPKGGVLALVDEHDEILAADRRERGW